MEHMYFTDCGYEHPSIQPKVAEALLIDQIIEGYLVLLRQPLSLENEDILHNDIPIEDKQSFLQDENLRRKSLF